MNLFGHHLCRFRLLCRRPYFVLLSLFLTVILIRSAFNHRRSQTLPATTTESNLNKASRQTKRTEKYLGIDKTHADQACILPVLDLWNREILSVYKDPVTKFKCLESPEDWIRTDAGTLRVSEAALRQHGLITCDQSVINERFDDFRVTVSRSRDPIKNGDKLTSDFFQIRCRGSNGTTYNNTHAGVVRNENALKRSEVKRKAYFRNGHAAMDLDVLILGFDSVSRLAWQRSLPKVHEYFVKSLGGVVMEGFNIVGDGTTQALLAMLTGSTETELHESRRGFKDAAPVDDFPWIWNKFKDAGYVTQFGEDQPRFGIFQYRLLGFKHQPVDHYMRPFHLSIMSSSRHPYCLPGSTPTHLGTINWMKEFIDVYKDQRKFSFAMSAELTHDSGVQLSLAEQDVLEFLKELNDTGRLDNTMIILMSDHGARFASVRGTDQGRFEERNPYFGIRMPPRFRQEYAKAYQNLELNLKRLVTPFDIHATFQHLLNYSDAEPLGDLSQRGISVFKEIPKERACAHAGVDPHWCNCLSMYKISVTDEHVVQGAIEIVRMINNMTDADRSLCAELNVSVIKSALTFSPNKDLFMFKKSADMHGRVPEFDQSARPTEILYIITLLTSPNDGQYEATVSYLPDTGRFHADPHSISRINLYGDQPRCIMDRKPHLRMFCYCTDQTNRSGGM